MAKLSNTNKGLNILILDQGRQSLPFLKAFAKSGHHTTVVCNSRLNEVYFSRYPSKKLLWPSYVKDREAFEHRLLNYLENNHVDVTISVGDISSEILARNKEEISKYTNITSPDYATFTQATDKLKLMQFCMVNNLPCPKTFALEKETLNSLNNLLEFPVMVKPVRGLGAVGIKRFDNQEDVIKEFHLLKDKYGDLLIQQFIPQDGGGVQYQAEAFLDENSKMKVCLVILKPRFFPVNGGTSTANVTINHLEIINITKSLLESLMWKGAADVDYILDPRDNKVKILEINPRVTAGIKIGFIAGIDYADLHLKLALGHEIPEIKNYKTGIYLRNFFLEILWFTFSDFKMKKNTHPPFFKIFGKDMYDQVFSLDDPLTGLGFFLNMIRKYLDIKNFKSKFCK